MIYPRYIAYHEAGHAVANLAVGHDFIYVATYRSPRLKVINGKDTIVQGVIWKGDDDGRTYNPIQLAATCLAGPLAEARYRRCSSVVAMLEHGMPDMATVGKHLEGSAFTYEDAEKYTKGILSDHWPGVVRLAEALRNTWNPITYANAVRIAGIPVGSSQSWAMYLYGKLQMRQEMLQGLRQGV